MALHPRSRSSETGDVSHTGCRRLLRAGMQLKEAWKQCRSTCEDPSRTSAYMPPAHLCPCAASKLWRWQDRAALRCMHAAQVYDNKVYDLLRSMAAGRGAARQALEIKVLNQAAYVPGLTQVLSTGGREEGGMLVGATQMLCQRMHACVRTAVSHPANPQCVAPIDPVIQRAAAAGAWCMGSAITIMIVRGATPPVCVCAAALCRRGRRVRAVCRRCAAAQAGGHRRQQRVQPQPRRLHGERRPAGRGRT